MVLSLTPKTEATKTKLDGRIHQTEKFCTAQETMNNLKRQCSSNAPGISEAGGDGSSAVGKRVGWERMVTSQVMSESLGWPPSVCTWLHIGRNSRASHSEVKEGQSREETGYTESLGHPGRQVQHQGVGLSVFTGRGSLHRLMRGRSMPAIFRKG